MQLIQFLFQLKIADPKFLRKTGKPSWSLFSCKIPGYRPGTFLQNELACKGILGYFLFFLSSYLLENTSKLLLFVLSATLTLQESNFTYKDFRGNLLWLLAR